MLRRTLGAAARERLLRSWWQPQPDGLARTLAPLAWIVGQMVRLRARRARARWRAPCAVVVVGNLVVGGAGKTPTVIALVTAMRDAGWHPGVISRGHGRTDVGAVVPVHPDSSPAEAGDEPLLIRRRTACPVFVGADRVAAAQALLRAHPEVDLLVADDGLQHLALARDAELWLFDERGVGNGCLLPAGPLRQALPDRAPAHAHVLYNAPRATTPLPGSLLTRRLAGALPLDRWHAGDPMDPAAFGALQGRRLHAMAGIAAPERFFAMLRAEGLRLDPLPLPDHDRLDTLPWPADAQDVLCTEKDAVKLAPARCGATRVWVVGLDLALPSPMLASLQAQLDPLRRRP